MNSGATRCNVSKTIIWNQWSERVSCRSLKGTVADMARYMGPTASVSEILEKLSVIFSTVSIF